MAKPNPDLAVIRQVLAAQFPDFSELSPLVEGEESRAYAFLASGGPYVLRVNRQRGGFDKDRLAANRFAQRLPIPEVHLIAPCGRDWLCISAKLPGDTLQALPPGGAYAYGQAVQDVLEGLSLTELAGPSGFGSMDGSGAAPLAHWRDFFALPSQVDWAGLAPAAQAVEIGTLASGLARWSEDLPDRRGLIHGDFGSNNVLVADGTVTGLIDWSEAKLGDPDYDLANILFWRDWLDCMEQQCRYFETEAPHLLAEADKLLGYQLRIGLETLSEALQAGDNRTADWAFQRCRELGRQLGV
ncbi:MAG: aminoglycoside phosphotransferase family protein [Devosia sp.]|uniref:phosphotransferase family protein n=1 Tax=Devosia sp. TaxID=1871048 RepID=UPI0024C7F137|nr:aminoglycoside phosphotransferase family protein [Devosia sp.]UYN99740.1 MAG: aminoglycoside phosphotransferase family protein [Devosia sp.]